MNVKYRLNRRGLRQSTWSTPYEKGKAGVEKLIIYYQSQPRKRYSYFNQRRLSFLSFILHGTYLIVDYWYSFLTLTIGVLQYVDLTND